MKTILVPTDYSDTSLEALKFAVDIAGIYQARLLVFHAFEIPDGILFDYPFKGDMIKVMKDKSKLSYENWIKKLDTQNVNVHFEVEQNSTVSAIRRVIEAKEIDLVVMGTHGITGLSEFFVGSTTEKIVRFSPVPVFSVKKSVKADKLKNIIFPTGLAFNETRLVKKVKELQLLFKSKLHIIYVNTPTNFKQDMVLEGMLKDYVAHYQFENYKTKIVSDMFEQAGIMNYANRQKDAVIAMGTHSHRGLTHFFRGSIAEDLVNHENNPIWTYSLKNED